MTEQGCLHFIFGLAPQFKKYSTSFPHFIRVATISGLLYSHLSESSLAPFCCSRTTIVMTSSMMEGSVRLGRAEVDMRLVRGVLPPLSKVLASAPATSSWDTTSMCLLVTANWNENLDYCKKMCNTKTKPTAAIPKVHVIVYCIETLWSASTYYLSVILLFSNHKHLLILWILVNQLEKMFQNFFQRYCLSLEFWPEVLSCSPKCPPDR